MMTERERFEAWYLSKYRADMIGSPHCSDQWITWQAALKGGEPVAWLVQGKGQGEPETIFLIDITNDGLYRNELEADKQYYRTIPLYTSPHCG